MAGPIQVEVTRGGVVEAVHTVHAVAVRDGRIVAEAGDPRLVTFLRSSAKPLQALPLVRARPDLDDREIAIACASHLSRPEQLDAVRALLATARATEDELETGPSPRSTTTARASTPGSWPSAARAASRPHGYRLASHPLQQELLAEIAGAADVDPARIAVAIDGCGVPTFALPLDRCAHAFGQLPRLDGGARVIAAMRAHPEMLRGPVAADAMLVRELDGWVAKGGAEGLFCACSRRWAGRRAQGRGRLVPRDSPCTCRVFRAGSASRPGTSASSRWKTATARPSARSGRRPESRVPKGRSRV